MEEPPERIRTVCITGFTPEAHPRELKNLCRWRPGFEGAHVAFAGGARHVPTCLFVKFTKPELAHACIDAVNGQAFDVDNPLPAFTLKAELARRDMEVRHTTLPARAGWPVMEIGKPLRVRDGLVAVHPAPVHNAGYGRACFAGGYVAGGGMGGCGGAFGGGCPGGAFGGGGGGYGYAPAPQPAFNGAGQPHGQPYGQPYGHGAGGGGVQIVGPPKRIRGIGPNGLDTITILNYRDKNLNESYLKDWFSDQPGFVTCHINERIGAVFIKFSDNKAAEAGLQAATAAGVGAEWAHRNLDL